MVIEIPGEITFSRTYNIPPISVELPLTAHARTFKQGAATALILFYALPIAAMLLIFTVFFFKGAIQTEIINSVIFLAMLIFLIISLMPKEIYGLIDFAHSGPILIFDSRGFTDRRGSISLLWSDISSAQMTYMRHHAGVRLVLRNPIPPRFLFDRGSPGVLGRRKADVYEVSVSGLSERAHVLSQTMLVLVRQNGGTVEH